MTPRERCLAILARTDIDDAEKLERLFDVFEAIYTESYTEVAEELETKH
jgi:hypothetical protein